MKKLRAFFNKLFMNTKAGRLLLNSRFKSRYNNSGRYWEERYKKNGTSGTGSYGEHAIYKAAILNRFVLEHNIIKVIEWGCGDSNQLKSFDFISYLGIDVSRTAVEKCMENFPDDSSKAFFVSDPLKNRLIADQFNAELALSLDVIYHLVEDHVFERYMHDLFSSAARYVIIYAWDTDEKKKFHVRHRKFTAWIQNNITGWMLRKIIQDDPGPFSHFYIYGKQKN